MTSPGGTQQIMEAARAAEQSERWDDAVRLYQSGLDAARAEDDEKRAADILVALGRVCFERGAYELANQHFVDSLVTARRAGELQQVATALNAMAVVAQFRGELDVAEPLYAQAESVARRVGDDRLGAVVSQNLGTLANIRGDLPTAIMRYHAALQKFKALGNLRSASLVLNNMGMLHVDVGEYAEAELCFNAAYSLAEPAGDHVTLGKIETNRAELYIRKQNYEQARECCDRAFRTFSELASHSGLGEVHKFYGILHRETGRLNVAHVQFSLALELARRCDNPLLLAETESERARAFVTEGRHKQAIAALNRAYRIFCELDARREILDLRRRLDRLEEPFLNAIQLWVDTEPAMQSFRPLVRGRRVAEYACALADAVGYGDTNELRIACYLLDVGTSMLPPDLVAKPDPLTPDERTLVRAHPVHGDSILADLEFPEPVRRIVRHHHERWDGNGYPDGLAGENIPLGARIVAIADQYDALTTERSYRTALGPSVAIAVMRPESGHAFDPDLFSAFLGLRPVREDLRLANDLRTRDTAV